MQAANAELVGLVRSHLPFRIYGGERWWALFRTAALVRMADTVESLMDLMAAEHDLDGQILVRSLYEQVVTFAWLSIDPDTRQWRWVGEGRWDLLNPTTTPQITPAPSLPALAAARNHESRGPTRVH
jgi:hypothetical protein